MSTEPITDAIELLIKELPDSLDQCFYKYPGRDILLFDVYTRIRFHRGKADDDPAQPHLMNALIRELVKRDYELHGLTEISVADIAQCYDTPQCRIRKILMESGNIEGDALTEAEMDHTIKHCEEEYMKYGVAEADASNLPEVLSDLFDRFPNYKPPSDTPAYEPPTQQDRLEEMMERSRVIKEILLNRFVKKRNAYYFPDVMTLYDNNGVCVCEDNYKSELGELGFERRKELGIVYYARKNEPPPSINELLREGR